MIPSRRSAGQQLLTILLLIVLIALVPLAQASPIDPTWIAGLWDGGDADDAVLLAISTAGSLDGAPATEVQAFLAPVGFMAPAELEYPPVAVRAPSSGRAPPGH